MSMPTYPTDPEIVYLPLRSRVDCEKGSYSMNEDGDVRICCPKCSKWGSSNIDVKHYDCPKCDFDKDISLTTYGSGDSSGTKESTLKKRLFG